MVDYTQPTMRDESWRRWKGGAALADELRNFYTAKGVFNRIAAQNPMGPTTSASTGCVACKQRRQAMLKYFLGGPRRGAGQRRAELMASLRGDNKEAPVVGLPGQVAPGR